jgi:hypothetical protein
MASIDKIRAWRTKVRPDSERERERVVCVDESCVGEQTFQRWINARFFETYGPTARFVKNLQTEMCGNGRASEFG